LVQNSRKKLGKRRVEIKAFDTLRMIESLYYFCLLQAGQCMVRFWIPICGFESSRYVQFKPFQGFVIHFRITTKEPYRYIGSMSFHKINLVDIVLVVWHNKTIHYSTIVCLV